MFDQFHRAIKNNDIEHVEHLIVKCDPNVRFEENGLTPLHLAAWYDKPQIIEVLIRHGAKADRVEKNTKKTPMHIATYFGHLDSIKTLIENEVSLNDPDICSFSPIHYACLRGHLEVVQYLIEKGANFFLGSRCGDSIEIAVRHEYVELVDYLISEFKSSSLLKFTSSWNSKRYWQKTFSSESGGWNALHFATLLGSEKLVRLILDRKYHPYQKDTELWTPLQLAAKDGYVEIVKLLLENTEAQIDEYGNYGRTPVEFALMNGHQDVLDLFSQYGGTELINKLKPKMHGPRPSEPLFGAVWDGNLAKIKEIVENEGEHILLQKDKCGHTVLHLSILFRQTEIAKFVIECGGIELIKLKDSYQETPLHYAAKKGYLEIYQLILEKGGNSLLSEKDNSRRTPLDSAGLRCQFKIIEWTAKQPDITLPFDQLLNVFDVESWALMDWDPKLGGYFSRMEDVFNKSACTSGTKSSPC